MILIWLMASLQFVLVALNRRNLLVRSCHRSILHSLSWSLIIVLFSSLVLSKSPTSLAVREPAHHYIIFYAWIVIRVSMVQVPVSLHITEVDLCLLFLTRMVLSGCVLRGYMRPFWTYVSKTKFCNLCLSKNVVSSPTGVWLDVHLFCKIGHSPMLWREKNRQQQPQPLAVHRRVLVSERVHWFEQGHICIYSCWIEP